MNEFLSIENYLPHRGVMLLLDRLLDASSEGARSQVCVPRDGLFLQDAGMPAWVGLEYMAQTVAAWAGWQALQAGRPVKLGFLLGTRRFHAACAHFLPGSVLHVSAHCELLAANGLGMFDCRIQLQGDEAVLAQARICVYEPDDGHAFIHALEQEGATPA